MSWKAAQKDERVKQIGREAYNWAPANDAEAAEMSALLDAVDRIENGEKHTKAQKIAAVYRPPPRV